MTLEELLHELSAYWRTPAHTDAFAERLRDVCGRHPRLFDAVEGRIVAQLFKVSPIATVAGLTRDQFAEWLGSLGPLILKREEERIAAERRREQLEEEASQRRIAEAAEQYLRQQESWELARAEERRRHQLLVESQKQKRAAWISHLASVMLDRQRFDRDKLIDFMRSRNIRSLVHFTRAENLASILKSGIVPRAFLSEDAIFNDQMRLDGFTEASSLSISFPNYRMFYAYQDKNQNQNWVVIGIHPDVLLDLPCLYFSSNAASAGVRKDDEQALAAQMSVVGLSEMFYENHEIDRCMRGLETNWPTDPQAEVLVFGTIDPRYFMGFAFKFWVLQTFLWVGSTLSRMVFKEGMRWKAWSCTGNCLG